MLLLTMLLACGTKEPEPVQTANTHYRQMYLESLEEKTPGVVAGILDEEKSAQVERVLRDYAHILKENEGKVRSGELNDYTAAAKLIEVRGEAMVRLRFILGDEEANRIGEEALGKSLGQKDWTAARSAEEQKKLDEEMEAFFGNE